MQRSLFLSLLSNWLGLVVTVLVGLLLTPFIVKHLGLQQFGIWTLVVGIASQLVALDLGIKTTIISLSAKYRAAGDQPALSALVSSASIVLAILAGLGLMVLLAINFYFPVWFSIPEELVGIARLVLLVVSIEAS